MMANYIDRDLAIERARLLYCGKCDSVNGRMCINCTFDDAMDLIEETPSSDVVPKSEVEKIFKEFERLMENNEVWFRQTDEIREEFAELKKKYTEADDV